MNGLEGWGQDECEIAVFVCVMFDTELSSFLDLSWYVGRWITDSVTYIT
jgi:hypothetical protein